jgi:hypothetical protein
MKGPWTDSIRLDGAGHDCDIVPPHNDKKMTPGDYQTFRLIARTGG